ncbi:sigma-70 family RNA polymerase sigma factor [Eubacterium sp.]|jgi:RNA polymerase primary sigma factor|uniref:sigma-70 family RNA polymerase sigma factor n=1 Tax=Eubacterium sp. TaxID=142586 RepID=UPI00265D46EB|nr:sigma-70 family RNA polymerase sigma factor [uncultured Eubacterium sp.]
MDKKTMFNEALAKLVSYATAHDNLITMEDVKSFFNGLIDDDSQYKLIYDYLSINKIEIKGFTPSDDNIFDDSHGMNAISENIAKDENGQSQEETDFIKMYMDDMGALQTVSDVEQAALVNKLIAGDASASTPLVESKLKKVADIAKKYCGKGVTFGDLIQEGNLELMVAVSEYTKECGDFNNYIDKRIEQGIRNVINSQINSDRIGQHLADKLNQLDNTTSKLSKELGRVPEISELADAMGITEDEASLLLKTSLDTLSVNQDTQITDAKTAEEIAKEGTVSVEDLINNNSVSADGFMGQSYASTDDSMDITKPASGSDPLTWRKHTR